MHGKPDDPEAILDEMIAATIDLRTRLERLLYGAGHEAVRRQHETTRQQQQRAARRASFRVIEGGQRCLITSTR